MNKAGWTFHVLSPVYLIHWGFQELNLHPSYRAIQNEENGAKFTQFVKEIETKYSAQSNYIVVVVKVSLP